MTVYLRATKGEVLSSARRPLFPSSSPGTIMAIMQKSGTKQPGQLVQVADFISNICRPSLFHDIRLTHRKQQPMRARQVRENTRDDAQRRGYALVGKVEDRQVIDLTLGPIEDVRFQGGRPRLPDKRVGLRHRVSEQYCDFISVVDGEFSSPMKAPLSGALAPCGRDEWDRQSDDDRQDGKNRLQPARQTGVVFDPTQRCRFDAHLRCIHFFGGLGSGRGWGRGSGLAGGVDFCPQSAFPRRSGGRSLCVGAIG